MKSADLREVTYRAVGEGTGRDVDLDRFDDDYQHLFLWDRKQQQVVGAYRIGQTDRLVAARGVDGLYTRTLFKVRQPAACAPRRTGARARALLHPRGVSEELQRAAAAVAWHRAVRRAQPAVSLPLRAGERQRAVFEQLPCAADGVSAPEPP